jgi:hypothetical protein
MHRRSAHNFDQGKVERVSIQIVEADNKTVACEVSVITESDKEKDEATAPTKILIMSVLQGLFKLAVNNKIKTRVYFDLKCKEYLKTIILKGNAYEINYALRLCKLNIEIKGANRKSK